MRFDEPFRPEDTTVDNALANTLMGLYGFVPLTTRYEAARTARKIVERWIGTNAGRLDSGTRQRIDEAVRAAAGTVNLPALATELSDEVLRLLEPEITRVRVVTEWRDRLAAEVAEIRALLVRAEPKADLPDYAYVSTTDIARAVVDQRDQYGEIVKTWQELWDDKEEWEKEAKRSWTLLDDARNALADLREVLTTSHEVEAARVENLEGKES